jgi:HD superfamily phosphodiesterase
VLDGLKIDVAVEVAGSIVKTNSAYVEGNRVTLLQMDFSQLLQDQDQLAKLSQPKSIEEAKAALKNIKGFKVNIEKQIDIEFAAK